MSSGTTVKQYPGLIDTFSTWQNDVDVIAAHIVNDLQDQIIAIETELGTNPAGSQVDLKTRLGIVLNDDGTLKSYTIYGTNPYMTVGDDASNNVSYSWNSANDYAIVQTLKTGSPSGNLALQPAGGNVGVGTTNPGEALQVNGCIKATGQLTTLVANSTSIDYSVAGVGRLIVFGSDVSTNGKFDLLTRRSDGSNSLRPISVISNGNVGVGTTDPQTNLDINGTIAIRGGSPAAGYVLQSDSVGIGTWVSPDVLGANWTLTGNNLTNDNTGTVGIGSDLLVTGKVGIGTYGATIDDVHLVISRDASGAGGHGHAFTDTSIVTRSNMSAYGYNSYDCSVVISGTGNFDHIAPFQSRPTYSRTSSAANDLYGFISLPNQTSGTISRVSHFMAKNLVQGGGVTSAQYGFYSSELTAGTQNWSVYTYGATPSYFGGNVGFGIGNDNPQTTVSIRKTDSATDTTVYPLWMYHATSATPAAGLGVGMLFNAKRSDSAEAAIAAISASWVNTTAGVESGNLIFSPMHSGNLTERVRITNDGKVGIGTTNPLFNLHVESSSNVILYAKSSGTTFVDLVGNKTGSNATFASIELINSGDSVAKIVGWRDGADDRGALIFHTQYSNAENTVERMRIDSLGNVGIGTNNPEVKLAISDSPDCILSLIRNGSANTTDECAFAFFAKDANSTLQKTMSISSQWRNTSGTNGYNSLRLNSTYLSGGSQLDDLQIQLFGGKGTTFFGESITDVPDSITLGTKLLIRGHTEIASYELRLTGNGSIQQNSTVGSILAVNGNATKEPLTLLNNSTGDNATVRLNFGTNVANYAATISMYGGNHATSANMFRIANETGAGLKLSGSGSDDVTISSTGKVGIGSEIPSHLLDMEASGGGYYSVTDHQWHNGSTRAIKQDIVPNEIDVIAILDSVLVVNYRYKSEVANDHDAQVHIGFIADDTDELLATREHNSMATGDCIGLLLAVVKEQQKMIDDLKARVAALEA